jgi:hypothetical protein
MPRPVQPEPDPSSAARRRASSPNTRNGLRQDKARGMRWELSCWCVLRLTVCPKASRRYHDFMASSDGWGFWAKTFIVGVAIAVVAAVIIAVLHIGSGSPSSSSPGAATGSSPAGPVPTNLAGKKYSFLWHQSISIDTVGLTGVTFQQNGPAIGASFVDLGYYSDSGWATYSKSSLTEWLAHGAPSATDCANSSSGKTAFSTIAEVGDEYCFFDGNGPNGPILVAITVTGISKVAEGPITEENGITFYATAWTPN